MPAERFEPGPTDPADRLVPRRVTPAEAASAYEKAASYSGDKDDEPLPPRIAYLTLSVLAAAIGAILAILFQRWKRS